jgi:predicted RNA-binding protein with PIN domain
VSAPDEALTAPLPPSVRQRVVGWAATLLGGLAADEVPPTLKAVARFAPTKRARTGANQLAAALDGDPLFRQRVGAWARVDQPELSRAVEAGEHPPAADPVEVAALAYLLRPPGWPAVVHRVVEVLAAADRGLAAARASDEVARLSELLEQARAQGRIALEQARAETATHSAAAEQARRQLRRAEAEVGRLRAGTEQALARADQTERQAQDAGLAYANEARRLRSRLAEAHAALEAARRASRDGRNADSIRLRLLLDTVVEAAHGLRRELALPPLPHPLQRPADTVAGDGAVTPDPAGVADLAVRALAADDPALLDQLLDLPQVHLVVDGYNVTKSGYGTLSLAEQRNRLVNGLAALARRTRAEVTCVFDGTTLDVRVIQASPRGVRVLFSPEGETADELIRRLVRAEPPGRPVVVVSSDREVADGVLSAGARPIPSSLLLRRLDRV